MKNLWTPWRMEHVTGRTAGQEGCLFEPSGSESQSREHLLLFRDEISVVLLNRFPYSNGHLLIAPARHVGDLTELDAAESLQLMRLLQQSCRILRSRFKPDGFNIGLNLGKTAGAGIDDHLHFHVVPRWDGDHNFMTITAEIRTIPQHIDHTFALLAEDFQTLIKEKNDQPAG